MRNLKASPRVPFPQLPFSFGDKPVRQTTRRLRWGAGGGASRPRHVGLSVCGGARFTCPPPSGWRRGEAVSVEASGCEGSRRPSGAQAETFSAPHRPGPLLPSTASEPTPTRKQPRGASVSRLSPGPGHSTRSRGSSWRAGGLGGAPASSSPTRSARGGRPAPRTWAASDRRRVPSALTHRWDEGRRGLGAAPGPGPALASFRLPEMVPRLSPATRWEPVPEDGTP